MKNATSIEQECIRRRDVRDMFTFTIDPADAKDFDDALSFVKLDDETFQIGVHIADVSFYVQPGDDNDKRAYEKGTSTYYVDHVDPMLPEELCNDLCSLRPNEDKLCMSVIFNMDASARVHKYKVCRTVIRSDFRLSYEQAQDIISNIQSPISNNLSAALHTLNALAHKLRADRMAAGALDIEQEEPQFILDEHGHPTDIYFKKPTDANHLIEEFMLLANRTIATEMAKRGKEFVYRVHDKPDQEKLANVARFEKHFGDKIPSSVIEMLTIRAMAKAVYSTKNIGHYGLAFDYYTHFTSPIRRYPDLMVHRLVARYILGERSRDAMHSVSPDGRPLDLEDACRHCSDTEQLAQQAERDSVKTMMAIWMHDHLGEQFDGTISGVTDFGIFVQLDGNRCEGLIHINDLVPNDYMLYDEKNYRLIAQESGKTFTLGDRLRVIVTRADIDKHQIDFSIASNALANLEPAPKKSRTPKQPKKKSRRR